MAKKKYTAEEKAAYYAANPDALKKKLEREAKDLKGGKSRSKSWASKDYSKSYGKMVDASSASKTQVSPFLRHLLDVEYMSPYNKNSIPPANPNSLGNFVTMDLLSHAGLSVTTTGGGVYSCFIFQPSARHVRQVWAGVLNPATGGTAISLDNISPLWKFTSGEAPTNVRPLRAGVRIKNTTRQDTVAGMVRVLQTSSAIEWDFGASLALTPTMATEIINMVLTNPKTVEYSGQQFVDGRNEIVCAPATMAAYNSYGEQFVATTAVADTETAWGNIVKDMPMNNIIILFDSVSAANTYSFGICEQVACRFPQNTVLSTLQRPAPVGDTRSSRLEAAARAAAKQGGNLVVNQPHPGANAGGIA